MGSGRLPKFSNESFKCSNDDLYFPATEVPLTAFHRNEIIDSKKLLSSMLLIVLVLEEAEVMEGIQEVNELHQFNKGELYWFTHQVNQ